MIAVSKMTPHVRKRLRLVAEAAGSVQLATDTAFVLGLDVLCDLLRFEADGPPPKGSAREMLMQAYRRAMSPEAPQAEPAQATPVVAEAS